MVVDAIEVEHGPEEAGVCAGRVGRSTHAVWEPALRSDEQPIDLLEEQAADAGPGARADPARADAGLAVHVLPRRRAADGADLAATPRLGLRGPAVRRRAPLELRGLRLARAPPVFDVNDFDETAPGPWEWDVKRLAASLEIAGREQRLRRRERTARSCAARSAPTGRRCGRSPSMSMLDVWYAHLDMDELLAAVPRARWTPSARRACGRRSRRRAPTTACRPSRSCADVVDGEPRIVSDPPLIVPIEELRERVDSERLAGGVCGIVRSLPRTLPADRRRLLEQYRLVHLARKVVGVGSVGTEAWIALLLGPGSRRTAVPADQGGEASVLERFTAPSAYQTTGERVVAGQRLMQAASDIFLGWERRRLGRAEPRLLRAPTPRLEGVGRHRGHDAGPAWSSGARCAAGRWRAPTPGRATGSRSRPTSAVGDVFDRADRRVRRAYADQNERDYRRLEAAVADGRLEARTGI